MSAFMRYTLPDKTTHDVRNETDMLKFEAYCKENGFEDKDVRYAIMKDVPGGAELFTDAIITDINKLFP